MWFLLTESDAEQRPGETWDDYLSRLVDDFRSCATGEIASYDDGTEFIADYADVLVHHPRSVEIELRLIDELDDMLDSEPGGSEYDDPYHDDGYD